MKLTRGFPGLAITTLLKAGHERTEVVRLTRVSPSSVDHIAGEARIEHLNDSAERRKLSASGKSSDILEKEAYLPSLEILREVRKAGYCGDKTALSAIVASLRPIELDIKRNKAFSWMRNDGSWKVGITGNVDYAELLHVVSGLNWIIIRCRLMA